MSGHNNATFLIKFFICINLLLISEGYGLLLIVYHDFLVGDSVKCGNNMFHVLERGTHVHRLCGENVAPPFYK